jgi:hypothetical protein
MERLVCFKFQNAVFGAGAPKTNKKKSIRTSSPSRGRQGAPAVDLTVGKTRKVQHTSSGWEDLLVLG